MRLIKYSNFIKESKEDIHSMCKKYGIKNYTINEDGTVDVDGNVDLHIKGLNRPQRYRASELKELPLKFGKVSGDFSCSIHKLTNLSGAPLEVGGYFSCSNNQLESLEGSPEKVGGKFYCNDNQLTSLEGAPRKVGGDFLCSHNKLTSLEGAPTSVGGDFECYDNQLTSLEGISKYIYGRINCRYNKLRDVSGVKDGWRGEFLVEDNPIHEIFKLFPFKRWDEVIEFLNEYAVIGPDNTIESDALKQVFIEMELPFLLKNYTLR